MSTQNPPWQKLALVNNLTFSPARFLYDKAQVEGQYRGYQLILRPWTFGVEIILSTARELLLPGDEDFAGQNITPEDINPLLAEPYLSSIVQGYIRATDYGRKFYYHQIAGMTNLETDLKQLQHLFDLLTTLADDYRHLLAQGGAAIAILQTLLAQRLAPQLLAPQLLGKCPKVPPLTLQLLQDIENETTHRLGHHAHRLLCPHCKTRFRVQQVDIPDLLDTVDLTYYGCRTCHQSWDFYEGQVIAALDNKMYPEQIIQPPKIWINWLMYYKLFDFDEVHIIEASDEEVERFAMRVSNDTDPIRQPQYQHIRCLVSPECNLSENTMRILRRTFGQVELR